MLLYEEEEDDPLQDCRSSGVKTGAIRLDPDNKTTPVGVWILDLGEGEKDIQVSMQI